MSGTRDPSWPGTPRSRWPRRWTSTSVTPTRPGSADPMRTPTGCCASTSPRAPTYPSTRLNGCSRSPPSSTHDLARHWAESHPQKPCSVYCLTPKGPSLRRPPEFAHRLAVINRGHDPNAAGPRPSDVVVRPVLAVNVHLLRRAAVRAGAGPFPTPGPVRSGEPAVVKRRIQDQQQDKGDGSATEDVPRPGTEHRQQRAVRRDRREVHVVGAGEPVETADERRVGRRDREHAHH